MAIAISLSACNWSHNEYNDLITAETYYYEYSGQPSWFTYADGGSPFYYDPTATGTFVINITQKLLSDGSTVDTGTITITVTDCTDDFTPRCCDNVFNIAWLSPEGGWKNYLFIGKATTALEQGKGLDFKDSSKVLKWSEVQDVYDAIIVGTGAIPKSHIDYTKSLRFAIQAYQYDASTGGWTIPIVINREKFVMYKRGDHFYEWTLEFKYATEIIVQTQ